MLVSNKFAIDALTLRRVDDINIDAADTITARAHYRVALQAMDDARLDRVVAGNDVYVNAPGDIIDVGSNTAAAIASGAQVRLLGNSIGGASASLPLRTQIAPTGSLIATTSLGMNVRQVATDTTINGAAQAINNLSALRVDSTGPMQIVVDEGDLLVGLATSATTVTFNAASSILDAYPDSTPGRAANIITTATGGASTGNVSLTAGATIGTSTNPLDIAIAGSELQSLSGSHTTLRSLGNLRARSMISTIGNITADVRGNLLVDFMQAQRGNVNVAVQGTVDVTKIQAVNGNVVLNSTGNASITNIESINGNVTLTVLGGISLNKIDALQGNVVITAINSIVDREGDAASDIDAINITINITNGSIGEPTDDLEINTANTASSSFTASAPGDILVTEVAGRLNINQVQSTSQGNIRLTTLDNATTGDDINATAGSLISARQRHAYPARR